jgi:Spy/CpxP family protein refolding chaperone
MTKAKAILIIAFLVTFAAGGAAGLLVAYLDHHPHGPSWLAAELNLTSEQKEQMNGIWSEVMGFAMRQRAEQSKSLRQERDQAVAGLLTAEQHPRYEAILEDYARKDAEMSEQRKQAFEEAIKRTKEILTHEQAVKYDELMKKQRDRGFGPPHGGHWGPPPQASPETRPESHPETTPESPAAPPEPSPDNQHAPRGGE